MPEPTYIDQGATFDPERVYRYTLWRAWHEDRPRVAFIMLNPSTADETVLDPTLRRCLGYAQAWGFGSFEIGNLFAYRSTDPRALASAADPVGPENDAALRGIAARAALVVAGWGTHGGLRYRDDDVVRKVLRDVNLHALRITKGGQPSHPLYLPATVKPALWRAGRPT